MHSSIGTPVETLQKAVDSIEEMGAVIRGRSRFFRTPAVPAGSGPDFVNAAISINAHWSSTEAIARLHEVESRLGRRRKVRWEQRVIDLDLLAHDQMIRPSVQVLRRWMELPVQKQKEMAPGQLLLPHPRMHERAFVLVPLADVEPDWIHPITRKSVSEMQDALPAAEIEAIVPIE
ncbi:2-amino-4-hydroxy-6-hydroxymethyldihydropteridine pyrophosphokinase [Tateyamaria omphalii]|nr:2-amino-4-hydroxy-6-hydroxymethyldihydropteridine pyrophosphokinase [Tateyamaria omphalii]